MEDKIKLFCCPKIISKFSAKHFQEKNVPNFFSVQMGLLTKRCVLDKVFTPPHIPFVNPTSPPLGYMARTRSNARARRHFVKRRGRRFVTANTEYSRFWPPARLLLKDPGGGSNEDTGENGLAAIQLPLGGHCKNNGLLLIWGGGNKTMHLKCIGALLPPPPKEAYCCSW